MDDKIKQFENAAKLFFGQVSSQELIQFLEAIMEAFKGYSAKIDKQIEDMKSAVSTYESNVDGKVNDLPTIIRNGLESIRTDLQAQVQKAVDAIETPENGLNGADGMNGQDGKDGADGKDGSPDTAEQVRDKLESLTGDARVDRKSIKGLESIVTATDLERGLSIVDQRTSFLINRVNAMLTGSIFTDPTIVVTSPSVNSAGYLGAPQNSQSAAYGLVLTDAGKHIYHPSADTSARTWTIPANSSVAFPIGTVIVLVNDTSAGVITLAITTDTLQWQSSTGSRTIAANGVGTLLKITATSWVLTGYNIT